MVIYLIFVVLIYNIWVSQFLTSGVSNCVFLNIQDIGLQNRKVFNFPNLSFSRLDYQKVIFLSFQNPDFLHLTLLDYLQSGFGQCLVFQFSKFVPDFHPLHFLISPRFDLARFLVCVQHIIIFLIPETLSFLCPILPNSRVIWSVRGV